LQLRFLTGTLRGMRVSAGGLAILLLFSLIDLPHVHAADAFSTAPECNRTEVPEVGKNVCAVWHCCMEEHTPAVCKNARRPAN
jgi:hypothetical protein